jgi:hypothetical protein
MSDDFVNQVTIDYLLNKEQYQNYLNNKLIKSCNKKDKKFYRKRIYNLTKELLLNKEEAYPVLPDVQYSFDNYIRSCIHYFKSLDNNDIIQEEYKYLDLLNTSLDDIELNDQNDEKEINDKNVKNDKKIDNLFMRSIPLQKKNLDSFVINKNKNNENIILPIQKEIDLKNPILKNKGISKKKNITNIYDEKNKKDKKDDKKD